MKNNDIEKILENIGGETVPDDVQHIAEEAAGQFSKNLKRERCITFKEYIMKTKALKIAAAAVILFIILAVVPFFSGDGAVSLATVLDKIENIEAFMYKMNMTTIGSMVPDMPAQKSRIESTLTISGDYGMKMENTVEVENMQSWKQIMYILPDKNTMYTVMPDQKKFMKMEFDDVWLEKIKQQQNDPRDMVRQIIDCDYTALGTDTIDGIEVEGFQTTDPAYAAGMMEDLKVTLWVDRQTQLPVKSEIAFKLNEQMQMEGVIEDFDWDIQVSPDDFEPQIDEEFTPVPGSGMKMPGMKEEDAIEGLRFFARIVGKYPENLNVITLMKDLMTITTTDDVNELTDEAQSLQEQLDDMDEEERQKKIMELMRPAQSLGMFYIMLIQEKKEPEYYGDTVGPEDANKILLKWKHSETQYRVIYGDLTAETLIPAALDELEKQ